MRRPSCRSYVPIGACACPACGAAVSGAADDVAEPPTQSPTMTAPAYGLSPTPASSASAAECYRIVSSLGRSGTGEVYRADDLKLKQPVAFKFLPEPLEAAAVRVAQLLEEVRIARQIAQPKLCRVYDVAEADPYHLVAMEYIEGEDLAAVLGQVGRCPREACAQVWRRDLPRSSGRPRPARAAPRAEAGQPGDRLERAGPDSRQFSRQEGFGRHGSGDKWAPSRADSETQGREGQPAHVPLPAPIGHNTA
ncbi:MAG: hypothetical protein GY719_15710 [bacterium]|nr:hypothetical protein [bacterium]